MLIVLVWWGLKKDVGHCVPFKRFSKLFVLHETNDPQNLTDFYHSINSHCYEIIRLFTCNSTTMGMLCIGTCLKRVSRAMTSFFLSTLQLHNCIYVKQNFEKMLNLKNCRLRKDNLCSRFGTAVLRTILCS